jgi:hypothetical protein
VRIILILRIAEFNLSFITIKNDSGIMVDNALNSKHDVRVSVFLLQSSEDF